LAQSTKVLVALFFDLLGEKTNRKKIDYFLLLDELVWKGPLCISRSKLTSPPPTKSTLPRSYRSIPLYRLCTVGALGCTQIAVAAAGRGQGIGKKPLEAGETQPGADGIRIVALNSSNFNEGGHAFFKRLDYSA
jgi:GNAT superfamily N-acetyltransferase